MKLYGIALLICILSACIGMEYIISSIAPSTADITSITACSKLKYTNATADRIQVDLTGKWLMPSGIYLFLNKSNEYFVLDDGVIVGGGIYTISIDSELIYLKFDRDSNLDGEFRICSDRLYTVSQNAIYTFECKCIL